VKRNLHIQLARIEAQIPYDSLKRAEVEHACKEFLTQSKPETWEWILEKNPKEVKEALWPSQQPKDDHKRSIYFTSQFLAFTRGWDTNYISYVGATDFHWRFSLYTAAQHHEERKDDYGILYLMGLTPAQFAQNVPIEKREPLLAEARRNIAVRFQELGKETVEAFRHPKELFQALHDLHLSELWAANE